ncbi:MAG TPA: hypothetical protein VM364_00810 [Vicinamibacterales bacterium]|nr:hypothetical protein [Vicinamibacterales bacterium]
MTLQNRLECQLRTPCTPRTAREYAHCTLRHTAAVPLEQIAAATAIPVKRLMKISAPQGDTQAKPEEIAAICRCTRRYEWLRFYVRQAGCELFELPDVAGAGADAEVLEQAAASLRSLSTVVDTLRTITAADSARGHRISTEERAVFKDVVGQHMAVVARLEAWVDAQSDAPLNPVAVVQMRRAN